MKWALMPVVDASVAIDWIAPGADPSSPSIRMLHALTRKNEAVMAPEVLYVECASVLVAGVRRNRWTGSDADAAGSERSTPSRASVGIVATLRQPSRLRHALRSDS